MRIYTIRDSKAEAYLQPFFATTDGVALRYITSALDDPDHEFTKHIEDYILFLIGQFDEETGELDPIPPLVVGKLIDLQQLPPIPMPSVQRSA